MEWHNVNELPAKRYICGYCGNDISSHVGYYYGEYNRVSTAHAYIYLCHHCNKPSFFENEKQTPGAIFGKAFDDDIFPDESIKTLYNEARNCMKVNAYSSVGMCCRKLLMHIAVNCGAKENQKFIEYVDYLDTKNYIPTNCKEWVDLIRQKGNDANHEIMILNVEDAKQLMRFIEMLISVIYEMPYQAKRYALSGNE